MVSQNIDDTNTFKILLASDCHLGFAEKDSERGNDSLITFEEILKVAKNRNVDFILLAGDLFHENKPSRRTLHGCMDLLRKYCMGDRPVQIEFLSDQSVNFGHCRFPIVNYEDSNLNISIPVFIIHGNHDDPAGTGNLCAIDLLAVSGLVNYFGKTTSLEKIQISPLLMQKGETKVALYGLGSIRDERLHRLFVSKCVTMLRPREGTDDWFNLFAIHQNRAKHGPTNYIPEQFLDDFLDLIIWGHEHECKIEPEWNGSQNFFVSQPGSSIATSLSPGEAIKKKVGILFINKRDFKIEAIPLETVRPFYTEDINLINTNLTPGDVKAVEEFCSEKVERLLERAQNELTNHRHQPKKPLIRLRIDYSDNYEVFSKHRFSQKFVEKVANPKDIVIFHRKKINEKKNEDEDFVLTEHDNVEYAQVEDLVKSILNDSSNSLQLLVLTEKSLSKAVQEFVDKEEKDAISGIVKYQINKTQNHLFVRAVSDDTFDQELAALQDERQKRPQQEDIENQQALRQIQQKSSSDIGSRSFDDILSSDSDEEPLTSKAVRGRGRGSRGTRGSRRVRGSQASKTRQNSSKGSSHQSTINSSFLSNGTKNLSRTSTKGLNFEEDSEEEPINKSKAKRKGVAFVDSDSDDERWEPKRKK